MKVNYGGLSMRLVRVLEFSRVPVLSDDQTSYLFTKFNLQAVGLINSQADPFRAEGPTFGMSHRRGALGSPLAVVPASEPDTSPPLTDVAIRHWMTVPRRTLVISTGGVELLRSPDPGKVCDAHDGPIVNAFSVREVMGDGRTFLVSFDITSYVNECSSNEGKVAALLANRWSQYHELDENYGLTIVTTGTAYFRTDLIHSTPLNPDDLRPYLFLPIPLGYQRENVKVQGTSDGSKIDYSFTDIQKAHQFVVGNEIGATKIEATYSQFLNTSGDFGGGVLGAMDRIQNRNWMSGRGKTKEGGEAFVPPEPKKKPRNPAELVGKPGKRKPKKAGGT